MVRPKEFIEGLIFVWKKVEWEKSGLARRGSDEVINVLVTLKNIYQAMVYSERPLFAKVRQLALSSA